MKVHELIDKLLKLPGNAPVVLELWVIGDGDTYDGYDQTAIETVRATEKNDVVIIRGEP